MTRMTLAGVSSRAPLTWTRSETRARRCASIARADARDGSAVSISLARAALGMITRDSVVGLSRGEHCAALARALGDARRDGALAGVRVVPLDVAAAKECAVNGVEVRGLDEVPAIAVTFAQPSECAEVRVNGERSFAAVFGRETTPVQPDIERVKETLRKSLKVVLLNELLVERIGGCIPVVVDAEDWEEHAEELDDLFLGDAEVWRRGSTFDANPRGGTAPYVSPDGSHTILDLRFEDPINGGRWECGLMLDGEPCGPYDLQYALENDVSGVRAHGIYTQADAVITVNPQNLEVRTLTRD